MGSSSDAWLSQVGGSTSSHSSSDAWLSQFGGTTAVGSGAKKKSSGGFSLGPFGGVADVLGNAGHQLGGIVSGIPNALATTGEAAWTDFAHPNPHDKRLTHWSFLVEHPIAYGESYLHDPGTFGGKVIEPQVKQVGADVHALRSGDWHYFEKHPLNPVLDALTVASFGGKAALAGARTGAFGEHAAELATSERLLKVGDHAEALNQAKTLQGRIRQQVIDKYSMAHPDMPLVGANVRMKRILNRRVATLTVRAGVPQRAFQRLTQGLTPPEVFAFHVAAEGVPLKDRIAYYEAQFAERMAAAHGRNVKSLRPIDDYLNNLTSPAVQNVLEHPRPEFVAALQAGKDLEERAGQRLVDTGQLASQSRAERALLPQRVVGGAEWVSGTKVTEKVETDQFTLQRKIVEDQISRHERAIRKGYAEIASLKTAPAKARRRKQIAFSREKLQGLRADLEAMGKPTRPKKVTHEVSSEFVGGPSIEALQANKSVETNLVNPALPAPFRFPHVGKKGGASLYKAARVNSMLSKAAPLDQLRRNAAIRFENALFVTDPAVLSTDYLQTMRHETILQMQKEALDPISQRLASDHAATGFKAPDEWYYRPNYSRKTAAPIPRQVREMETLTQDRAVVRDARGKVEEAAQGIVSKNLHSLGVDAHDLNNLEKLNEMGIRRVPAAFGQEFSKQYGGTHWAVRYFYDRPLDVWRAITLNYRPAWLVNNFVGNGIMGLATYGPQGAAAYLRTLLATERGPDKVMRLWKWTKARPTLRRKYGAVFQEVAPELHSAGLYGTQTKITNMGVYEGAIGGIVTHPAVKALGFVPKQIGKMVMKVGRGITRAEILLAEDTSREAAFIRQAGGDIAKIRQTAQKMGEGHLSLIDALKRMDQPSIERAVAGVNDALGDFNDLSHFERATVRRLIPFYSWFKVIAKVSGKYLARYPARVLLLKNIEDARNTTGEPALPAWLAGSVLVGKPHNGVQTLFSTQGLNPYETVNQIATGGAGSVLSPFVASFIIGLTGRDPSFGGLQDYYGLGANTRGGWGGQAEMAGGSLVGGLAPARVYSETTGPYQGKLYAPKTYGHIGPVALNDFLLQYLGIPIRHVKTGEAKREQGLK